ncbi:MAG: hypothetical protein AAGF19_09905 [Pseudomonadota bacterium]
MSKKTTIVQGGSLLGRRNEGKAKSTRLAQIMLLFGFAGFLMATQAHSSEPSTPKNPAFALSKLYSPATTPQPTDLPLLGASQIDFEVVRSRGRLMFPTRGSLGDLYAWDGQRSLGLSVSIKKRF